jgi:hypothetical protein
METVTYRFPDEEKTREAARTIFRSICDDVRYSAATATSQQFTHQRYAVSDGQDQEVMFYVVNAKGGTPSIVFNFIVPGHKTILEPVIAKAVEAQEGVEQKPLVWTS